MRYLAASSCGQVVPLWDQELHKNEYESPDGFEGPPSNNNNTIKFTDSNSPNLDS